METALRYQIALILLFSFLLAPASGSGEAAGPKPYAQPTIQGPVFLLIPDLFETPAIYEAGLAPYLAQKKQTVYLFDWQHPEPEATDGSFDDLAGRRLPQAMDLFHRQTGGRPVILVGHGFGGLAALVHAATTEKTNRPAAVVAIGAPGKLLLRNKIIDALIEAEQSYPPGTAIQTSAGARFPAPFSGVRTSVLDLLLTNDKNFDPAVRQHYYAKGLAPIARPLAKQAIRWVQTGQMKSLDGRVDYYERLSKVACPVLFLVGKVDNLVDPYESILAKEKIGSTDKSMRIFCIPNGHECDYGHTGLLLGPDAGQEVFPYLWKWASSRARRND